MISKKEEHELNVKHLVIDYWIIQCGIILMMAQGFIVNLPETAFWVYIILQPTMFVAWANLCAKTSFNYEWCKKTTRSFGYG